MSSRNRPGEPADRRPAGVRMPPSDPGRLAVAGVCLAVPVVALMWVSSYARETPEIGGVPFFFWYQFAWVFITSALTYTAYRLVLAARPHADKPFAGHHLANGDPRRGPAPDEQIGDADRIDPNPGFRP